jgi:hypothetical protein
MGTEISIPLRVLSVPGDDCEAGAFRVSIDHLHAAVPREAALAADVLQHNDPASEEEPEARAE